MSTRLLTLVSVVSLLSGDALAQQVSKPEDPQIAHIAYTAGDIDLAAAKQAIAKSNNKAIVALAADMVRDHEAVHKQARDIHRKLDFRPQDNDTSRALSEDAAEKRAQLAELSGSAYDEAYVANEVAYHKSVSRALETALIPSTRDPKLKRLLQRGLRIFREHQEHAERIAGELK
jgi:putative membrane protein